MKTKSKKNYQYTRCFICGNKETKYRKYIYYQDKRVLLPAEFYICDKCFRIQANKKYTLTDGNTYKWEKTIFF